MSKNYIKYEQIIEVIAKKQKLNKIIQVGSPELDCYIENIKKIKSNYELRLKILHKNFIILLNNYDESKVKNLIFVMSFFVVNKIDMQIIINNINKIPSVEGRGSSHDIFINNLKIKLIDQSYNANPETMTQCIKDFSSVKKKGFLKILILGEMNELGSKSLNFHYNVIYEVEKHLFDLVILSGDLLKKALSMFSKLENNYVYKSSSRSIMNYLSKNVHKKAILMAKSSNSTQVNKFIKQLKIKKEG